MKIGIDGRLIEETGVGRYVRNLTIQLGELDTENRYVIFLRKKSFDTFKLPNERWEKRLAEVPWHSIAEQIKMPGFLMKENLDLVHIPYFNVPIFYTGRLVVTIHDLTILHFDTGKATTLPLFLYKLRRLGYLLELRIGLKKASAIFAVSQTTKKELVDHLGIDSNKIIVTYEGVDDELRKQGLGMGRQERFIKEPYFLYVGNAYPHKNLDVLVEAFKMLVHIGEKKTNNLKLVLVGKEDFFYRRLKEKVRALALETQIIFFDQAEDGQLINLYKNAKALVFPSLMEGFGLPALEALSFDCPVLCSDILIFHEILGDSALYFDPNDHKDIAIKLENILSVGPQKKKLLESGKKVMERYSWKTMAQKTLQTYTNQHTSS